MPVHYGQPTMNTSTANPTMNTSPQPTTTTGIFRAGDDLTLTSEGSIIANGLDLVSQPARPAPLSRPHMRPFEYSTELAKAMCRSRATS